MALRWAQSKTRTGPWALDPGLWTLDSGLWTLDSGFQKKTKQKITKKLIN